MKDLAFICHASEDFNTANKIVTELEKSGIKCWIAPRDVDLGSTYAGEIVQGIRNSGHFIFLYTEESNKSKAVIKEIEKADSLNIPIIPFKMEEIPYNDSLEYYLRTKQSVMAFNKTLDSAIDELKNHIKDLPAAPSIPIAPPVITKKRAMIFGAVALFLVLVFYLMNTFTSKPPVELQEHTSVVNEVDPNIENAKDSVRDTDPETDPEVINEEPRIPPINILDITNGKVLINDKFENNTNRWAVGKTSSYRKTIANSMYSIENIKNRSFSPSNQKISIKSNYDFLIETTVRIAKNTNYFVGIGWSSDWKTKEQMRYTFTINTKSKIYTFYSNKGYLKRGKQYASHQSIFNRLTSNTIHPDYEWNKITIIRKKDVLRFFINEKLVNETPYTGINISMVGIGVGGQLKADFKDFKVKSSWGVLIRDYQLQDLQLRQ